MATALSPAYKHNNMDVIFSFSFNLESNSACILTNLLVAGLFEWALNYEQLVSLLQIEVVGYASYIPLTLRK
jgi:hypothetical protein